MIMGLIITIIKNELAECLLNEDREYMYMWLSSVIHFSFPIKLISKMSIYKEINIKTKKNSCNFLYKKREIKKRKCVPRNVDMFRVFLFPNENYIFLYLFPNE